MFSKTIVNNSFWRRGLKKATTTYRLSVCIVWIFARWQTPGYRRRFNLFFFFFFPFYFLLPVFKAVVHIYCTWLSLTSSHNNRTFSSRYIPTYFIDSSVRFFTFCLILRDIAHRINIIITWDKKYQKLFLLYVTVWLTIFFFSNVRKYKLSKEKRENVTIAREILHACFV